MPHDSVSSSDQAPTLGTCTWTDEIGKSDGVGSPPPREISPGRASSLNASLSGDGFRVLLSIERKDDQSRDFGVICGDEGVIGVLTFGFDSLVGTSWVLALACVRSNLKCDLSIIVSRSRSSLILAAINGAKLKGWSNGGLNYRLVITILNALMTTN